jgi:hypothetical protein
MDAAIRQLRTTARQLARGKHPSGIRYPAAFRDAVVTLARPRLGHGQSLAHVAGGWGVVSDARRLARAAGAAEPATGRGRARARFDDRATLARRARHAPGLPGRRARRRLRALA